MNWKEPVPAKRVHAALRRHILVDGWDFVFDFEKSRGAHLHDARSGRKFLDFFSFFSSLPVGYNHPRLRDRAYLRWLHRVAALKPSNSDIYTREYASFVEDFAKHAGRGRFSHYFFISGGAQATENAMKAAFDWKVRKNLSAGRGLKGRQILHFQEGFHGRTGYALSVTSPADPRKTQYYPVFDWPRISNPKCLFPLSGENLRRTEEAEQQALEEIERAFRQRPDEIAGIIIEPIQGEGGDNHFRPEFLQALRRIADEKEALLLLDEVQTGFGASGTLWMFEQLGFVPDILIFGKRSQISGISATRRLDEVESVFRVPSRINSTFGGDLTDMVRCRKYLEIILEEGLLENAKIQGEKILRGLREISAVHPQLASPRGRGLLLAFDLPTPEERDSFRTAAYAEGLLILPAGRKTIRLRPPLTVTPKDVEEGLEKIQAALRRMYR